MGGGKESNMQGVEAREQELDERRKSELLDYEKMRWEGERRITEG